ncbi:SMI1/KNR4 family protein [Aquimarina sp. AU58]|uniref:SMI1/KNR4 family protein n=1 Tax=Aquimarina sp. AU58 TaxID=1874112 RepID=UPI000D6E42D2|nr:SMI1/KNR4 family protein [Aquimarina sp. AU58]
MKELLNEIVSKPEGNRSNGEVSIEIINEIEKHLDIVFPEKYKEFLIEYGSGIIGYIDFFGVKKGLDIFLKTPPNIIYFNENLRKYGLRKDIIAISYAGDQEYFVLNCDLNHQNYGSVYVWNPSLANELIEELEYISDDIIDFVKKAFFEEL